MNSNNGQSSSPGTLPIFIRQFKSPYLKSKNHILKSIQHLSSTTYHTSLSYQNLHPFFQF